MKEAKKPGFRISLQVIAALAILLITIGFIAIVMNQQNNQLRLENFDAYSSGRYNASDLTVRGTIYDVKLNYEYRGEKTYHVFSALIYINITEVAWASEELLSEMGIQEYQKTVWDRQDTITIAYDKADVPELSIGQTIEASGVYFRLTGSVYLWKLVVAPSISESYVKTI